MYRIHTAVRWHRADTTYELSGLGSLDGRLITKMSRTSSGLASTVPACWSYWPVLQHCHCYNAVHAGVLKLAQMGLPVCSHTCRRLPNQEKDPLLESVKSGRQHQVQTMLIVTVKKKHKTLCPFPGVTGFVFF